jgi:hypothetical protein
VVKVPGERVDDFVRASTDDDSASFDAYFRRSKQPLVAMAYLLTGELQTAQDLTQEALLRTWSRWTLKGPETLQPGLTSRNPLSEAHPPWPCPSSTVSSDASSRQFVSTS